MKQTENSVINDIILESYLGTNKKLSRELYSDLTYVCPDVVATYPSFEVLLKLYWAKYAILN